MIAPTNFFIHFFFREEELWSSYANSVKNTKKKSLKELLRFFFSFIFSSFVLPLFFFLICLFSQIFELQVKECRANKQPGQSLFPFSSFPLSPSPPYPSNPGWAPKGKTVDLAEGGAGGRGGAREEGEGRGSGAGAGEEREEGPGVHWDSEDEADNDTLIVCFFLFPSFPSSPNLFSFFYPLPLPFRNGKNMYIIQL